MISAVCVPCDPSASNDREGARHERADEGDIRSDERDDGDRPGERNVENQRPDAHHDALNAATMVTPAEVTPQRADPRSP
jgi:hypothetical protein